MLTVDHITALAGPDLPIISDFFLNCRPGEVVGIAGPSGAGKTTLLRCIAGLQQLACGDITIAGKSIVRCPVAKRPIAFMQQNFPLYTQLNALENVLVSYGKRDALQRLYDADELFETVGLPSEIRNRGIGTLSGGECQRIALCKALLKKANVLLLDEPFSNLDKRRRRDLGVYVRERTKQIGTVTLIVSHDEAELVFIADVLCLMKAGRLVQSGNLEELWKRPVDEQVASFGIQTGMQAIATQALSAVNTEAIPPLDGMDGIPQYLAWRPDSGRINKDGSSMRAGDLRVVVDIVRTVPGTGGNYVQLSINIAEGTRHVWHFEPGNDTRLVGAERRVLCVAAEDLYAMDSHGRILWDGRRGRTNVVD